MITAKQAEKRHNKLRSRWSDESKLSQEILISILAHLEKQGHKKRKPSAYNLFFAQKASEGLSATEIAEEWKKTNA